MIVRFEDFKAESRIAGMYENANPLDSRVNTIKESLQEYIDKYEPIMLSMLLKECDIATIEEYASLDECDQGSYKLTRVLELLRKAISHYVWFYYNRSQFTTSVGAVRYNPEGGASVTSIDTQVLLWNQMVDVCKEVFTFYYGTSCYPEEEIFVKINTFNF